MSWLGTVSESDGYIRSVQRISREITIYVGGTPDSVVTQYAAATTYYWAGMSYAGADAWRGTLGSVTPKYAELNCDRVDDSGQYSVTAVSIGTWGA